MLWNKHEVKNIDNEWMGLKGTRRRSRKKHVLMFLFQLHYKAIMCEVTSNFTHKDQNLFIIETFVLHIRKEFPRKWGWKLQSYTRTKIMLLSNIAKGRIFHSLSAFLRCNVSNIFIVLYCVYLFTAMHNICSAFNGQSSFHKSIIFFLTFAFIHMKYFYLWD